jgi:hypothetical protein
MVRDRYRTAAEIFAAFEDYNHTFGRSPAAPSGVSWSRVAAASRTRSSGSNSTTGA